jgi:hypothetical protein
MNLPSIDGNKPPLLISSTTIEEEWLMKLPSCISLKMSSITTSIDSLAEVSQKKWRK